MKKERSLYQCYRFLSEIISHCVWLYFRFALSYRDVQEMMAERGVVVSHEASGAVHVREKGANNRAENSHQPTRNRERRMKGFKSVAQAQRFVSIFGMIYELFSVGRHFLRAEHFRLLLARRFETWRHVTKVAPIAA